MPMSNRNSIADARALRVGQTQAEALLWSVLRGRQLCDLKFRRQHPEPPYILDFACHANRCAVEIDGGYHDEQYEKDKQREQYLNEKGWDVIRFTNESVLNDVEAVAMAIAKHLGEAYQFRLRQGGSSNVLQRQRTEKDKKQREK